MAHDPRPSPDEGAPETPPGVPDREEERRRRVAALVLRRSTLTECEAQLLWQIFPAIYNAQHRRVWNQLRARVRDQATLEDLIQTTLATLYQLIVKEGFPDSLPRYVHKIAEGVLLNHVRDRRRSPLSIGLPSSDKEPPPPSPPQLERALDAAMLWQKVRPELTEDQWAVVDLVLLTELGYEEAAAVLDIPLGTLRSRLEAAKIILHRVAKRFIPPSQR